ncbi:hypothetical protein E4656_17020 [Natronospirillum operosum]|uniref:Uncharacterized protein n=1 Tax=Natronospirillum operosum TaxID=2759953 RepID=A0A4Z0W6Y3_9GAMM|nr:hypothetical protein [Natronospirillum operosum]TGG91095.1 hypothetical protein E4656_17020 [Natronospirillum operosum]
MTASWRTLTGGMIVWASLSGLAVAHECTNTRPLVSPEGDSLTLFQTLVEDWDVLRDRISDTGAITQLAELDASPDAVQTEAVSRSRSAQVEQVVVDVQGQTWEVFWGLADHHGDCTEVQVQVRWESGAFEPDSAAEFWAPVQAVLMQAENE